MEPRFRRALLCLQLPANKSSNSFTADIRACCLKSKHGHADPMTTLSLGRDGVAHGALVHGQVSRPTMPVNAISQRLTDEQNNSVT